MLPFIATVVISLEALLDGLEGPIQAMCSGHGLREMHEFMAP